MLADHISDPTEPIGVQKSPDSCLASTEPHVVLESLEARELQARLTWVYVTWVDISHHWQTALVVVAETVPHKRHREEPKVAAARKRHGHSRDSHDRDRKDRQFPMFSGHAKQVPVKAIDSSVVSGCRHDGHVNVKSLLGKYRICPEAFLPNGESRSAEARHGLAANILQDPARHRNFLPKLLRALFENKPMIVPVAADLMSQVADPPHQPRISLGDPSEHQERRLHIRIVEQAQQDVGILLDQRRCCVPRLGIIVLRLHPTNVKPFFQIDAERIGHRVACRQRQGDDALFA